jgi:uncharacterized protein YndB with AHSA1/START domain
VIAAPPDRVFAALVDPEALTAWLPPDGMSGRFERFDARPGGSYRLVLTYADASSARGKATADSDIVEAHFVDVVPGVRVVQAVDFVSDDPTHAGTMTMTWEITAVDAGTRSTSKTSRHRSSPPPISTGICRCSCGRADWVSCPWRSWRKSSRTRGSRGRRGTVPSSG